MVLPASMSSTTFCVCGIGFLNSRASISTILSMQCLFPFRYGRACLRTRAVHQYSTLPACLTKLCHEFERIFAATHGCAEAALCLRCSSADGPGNARFNRFFSPHGASANRDAIPQPGQRKTPARDACRGSFFGVVRLTSGRRLRRPSRRRKSRRPRSCRPRLHRRSHRRCRRAGSSCCWSTTRSCG